MCFSCPRALSLYFLLLRSSCVSVLSLLYLRNLSPYLATRRFSESKAGYTLPSRFITKLRSPTTYPSQALPVGQSIIPVMSATGASVMSPQTPQLRMHGCNDPEQLTVVDLGLAYRVGSSVLNRIPLYSRIRSYSSSGNASPEDTLLEEKFVLLAGTRTPPPGYYDVSALAKGVKLEEKGYTTNSGSKSISSASVAEIEERGEEDIPESTKLGYFPDTGAKRFLMSFGSLLRTLSSETPASDIVSSWLPGALRTLTEPEEAGNDIAHPMVSDHLHTLPNIAINNHDECDCFHCFQQKQLYLLWLQQRPHTRAPLHHTEPAHICSSYQQPSLPPRPVKPLLHRFTATLILRVFTIALTLYPHVKGILMSSYAWERRNHVAERVLAVMLALSERLWTVLVWVFGLNQGNLARWGDVDEQRVRKWLVKAGGEVLGGFVDGMQMGVGVWGEETKGTGKGKAVIVGV